METAILENELSEYGTFSFYTDMGGVSFPDELTFNRYKETEAMQLLILAPVLTERIAHGAARAVCKMAEIQYLDELTAAGKSDTAPESETIGGYSYTAGTATKLAQEKNFKSTEQKKRYYLNLYCVTQKAVL